MKKILIALALIFPAFFAAAQEIPAGIRMEVVEISDNDDQYSVFTYKDEDDGAAAYYLSVGRVYSSFEAVFEGGTDISLTHVDETELCMGQTAEEAQAFLESLLALFDKEPGTTVELPCRPVTGLPPRLGEAGTAACTVVKPLIFGKRLRITFESRGREALSEITKSSVKSLILSMKIERKLRPEG
ncbi:MAG: hypothetical protein K6F25_05350 [Bacteroidales bacterium]|nr:hypothetical protein [Bacteroidales bacterium]